MSYGLTGVYVAVERSEGNNDRTNVDREAIAQLSIRSPALPSDFRRNIIIRNVRNVTVEWKQSI